MSMCLEHSKTFRCLKFPDPDHTLWPTLTRC